MFIVIGKNKFEYLIKRIVEDADQQTAAALGKLRNLADVEEELQKKKEALEELRIQKMRKEEEYATREREIQHKIGLERKRQEFEIESAKRETTVSVREENLKADRARFEENMKFQNDRFTTEVGYLKDMVGQMLERLPSADIIARVGERKGS